MFGKSRVAAHSLLLALSGRRSVALTWRAAPCRAPARFWRVCPRTTALATWRLATTRWRCCDSAYRNRSDRHEAAGRGRRAAVSIARASSMMASIHVAVLRRRERAAASTWWCCQRCRRAGAVGVAELVCTLKLEARRRAPPFSRARHSTGASECREPLRCGRIGGLSTPRVHTKSQQTPC